MTAPSLPPGTSFLEKGCAGHGWFLASRSLAAWGWSPERGWIPLPPASRKIEEIRIVDDGFLVVLESGRKLGFWEPGAPSWGWWLNAPAEAKGSPWLSSNGRWRADGGLVCLQCGYSPGRQWVLYAVGRTGARRLRTFQIEGMGDLRGIQERGADPVRLFCEHGIATVPLHSGPPVVERWLPLGGEHVRMVDGRAFFAPGRHSERSQATRVLDPETGDLQLCPWPASSEFHLLREAAARGEAGRLDCLLAFLESLPDAPDRSHELLALQDGPEGPIAALTTAGVFPRGAAALTGTSSPHADRFARRRDLHALLLAADPEGTAAEVAGALIGGGGEAAELAFFQAFGETARERLAEAARGRLELVSCDLDLLRRLFGRAGGGATDLVSRLLGDDDPARRLLGAIVAGERLLELAPALSGRDGSPEDVLLRERFLSALRRPKAAVRCAALDSCGELELTGVLPEVLDRLREDEEGVRPIAVWTLLQLGDTGPPERALLRDLLRSEEWRVRDRIVEEFTRTWRVGDLGAAIDALGDPTYRVRYRGARAISEHVDELDAETLLVVLDGWLIQSLAAKAARTRGAPGLPMGLDDLPEDIMKGLGVSDPSDLDLDLPRLGPLLAGFMVLSPGLAALEKKEDWDDGPDAKDLQEEPFRRLDAAVPGILALLPAIVETFKEKGSARSLASFSSQLALWDDGHADRIAVVALLRALGDTGVKDAEIDAPPEKLSLAARLGRIGRRKTGLGACVERVRTLSRKSGPLALAGLLVLSLRDDLEARRELLRRIESGEVEPWWSVASALALGCTQEERLALARRVAGARAVPLGRRLQVLEALEDLDATLDPASEPVAVDLAEELASAKGCFPFARRVSQAWNLATASRAHPLLALWEEGEAKGLLGDEPRFELALALARAGELEHLDFVRARWPGERDGRAVEVLSLFGDLRDIPALETAREDYASAGMVDAAIAAIRERCGRD